MAAHTNVDMAMTDSGDLILIDKWVDSAQVYDSSSQKWVDHPLKGRGGDLLLSNEIDLIGGQRTSFADGSELTIPDLTKKDLETLYKYIGDPSIGGETFLGGVQYSVAFEPSEFQEVTIDIVPSILSPYKEGEAPSEASIRSFIQEVIMRIRTNAPDMEMHPTFGANLEDLIGEWNTRTVADYGLGNIVGQLSEIRGMEIMYATAIPLSDDKLVFVLRLKGVSDNIINVRIDFSFENGTVIKGGHVGPGA